MESISSVFLDDFAQERRDEFFWKADPLGPKRLPALDAPFRVERVVLALSQDCIGRTWN